MKPEDKDIAHKMARAEMRRPYVVNPDTLAALGYDPQQFSRPCGFGAGYILDRVKEADIIARVQAFELAPASTGTRN
jgi:hypothetical protein